MVTAVMFIESVSSNHFHDVYSLPSAASERQRATFRGGGGFRRAVAAPKDGSQVTSQAPALKAPRSLRDFHVPISITIRPLSATRR